MAFTIENYYHAGVPIDTAIITKEAWSAGVTPTVTIQPDTSNCDFVWRVEFLASDNVAFGANSGLKISTWGYKLVTFQKAETVEELVVLGDTQLYEKITLAGGTIFHKIVIEFKPPQYLRSTTTPAESFVIEYDGGNPITAGTLKIKVLGWELLETNSGIV